MRLRSTRIVAGHELIPHKMPFLNRNRLAKGDEFMLLFSSYSWREEERVRQTKKKI